ncbi:unnamed protein product [Leptidea sinapis]|uniref:Androgen-dependent TFPI-regulating protein n=1 Tax=Leptidea sinapis TaxID=189913 RepID=A0A5E4R0E8_9NEOP|nr:unnamed protein product [Leptidea sinapis]
MRSYHKTLTNIRDVIFTSLLWPIVSFSDMFFWSLFVNNPVMMMPLMAPKYVPTWAQHSMHTVSFVIVAFDLVTKPRERPKSVKNGFYLTIAFLVLYTAVDLSLSIT